VVKEVMSSIPVVVVVEPVLPKAIRLGSLPVAGLVLIFRMHLI
jgi:hypothetical protein